MTPTGHLENVVVTYRESLGPAMKITDQIDAYNYLIALIDYHEREGDGISRERATEIAKINLGYFAGYYNAETMERVNRLFETQHPIFGGKTPTPEEAFEAGKKAAR